MKASRKAGFTSSIFFVRLLDSSKRDGSGLAGLVYNTSGLACYYKRDSGAASVGVSLATITTLGVFASGGFKEVDATHQQGLYEFHAPDAALASGARNVVFYFQGAANLKQEAFGIELTAVDNQDGVRFGVTALPNAAASAAGGLLTFGTGAGQIQVDGAGNVYITDRLKKNQALLNYMFVMTDSTTHGPKTSLGNNFSVTRNLDGAGFQAGTITNQGEIGNGWYTFDFGAGDLNGNVIGLRITATGADDIGLTLLTQP